MIHSSHNTGATVSSSFIAFHFRTRKEVPQLFQCQFMLYSKTPVVRLFDLQLCLQIPKRKPFTSPDSLLSHLDILTVFSLPIHHC